MPDTLNFEDGNVLDTQLQAKQLPRVEKIPVFLILAAVEPVRLVARENRLVGNKARLEVRP
jgi:hypothetical protein